MNNEYMLKDMQSENDEFKVLLIDPAIKYRCADMARYINRGLLSIATFLKSKGIDVTYFSFDQYYSGGKIDDVAALKEIYKIISDKGIKVVGISNIFIAETEHCMDIAKFIKKNYHDIRIVVGGYNPTILNEKLICEEFIDFTVKGEGEWAMLDLVVALRDNKSTNKIPGIVSKNGEGPIRMHGDLNEIPPLNYSILPKKYFLGGNPPRINLELSRGCYMNCPLDG